MTETPAQRRRTRRGARGALASRQLVMAAFAVVVAGLVLGTASTLFQVRALQDNARHIVENMLASVRLVGELRSSLERRRILVDDHIFASRPAERAAIEAELAAVDARLAATSRAYDPWATLPDERATWTRTRADLAALDGPIARALAVSRLDRDLDARAEMQPVRGLFEVVERDLDRLIAINDQAANATLERFSMIRVRLMLTLLAMAAAGLACTGLVGRWVSREIARREARTLAERRALEARNRELDAFAGRVAHDIRGPLTAISLAAEQLATKVPPGTPPVGALHRNLRRMETLVDDLLTLARVEAQAGGCCDPAAVVAQVQEDLGARMAAEKATLRVAVPSARIACSEGLLRQAVTNLLENAVKYHRPDAAPEVEISGQAADGRYHLRVADNGVGMSREDAALAVEPFFRAERTQGLPGTGLGLSIVKRVAEANGGELTIETDLGRGSAFVVRLPLADG
ncbi:MAG TPA: ATP-binding protein, partial [Polyangia bacterium]|nr:ATP-binding protein [Polyangia bacterium]